MHGRIAIFLCLVLAFLAVGPDGAGAGDERPEAEGYGVRRAGRTVTRPAGMPLGATGAHGKPLPQGHVDVLCERGSASLYDCLQQAREADRGVLELPRGVNLRHVAGLFERGLTYYDLDEDFSRYHGYRFVMRFRALSDGELEARDRQRAGALGAGVAGGAALSVVAPFVPLTPIIFLFDSASAEADLARVREDAELRGVPPPNRGSFAATYQEYENTYRGYMEGSLSPADEQGVYGSYEVTQCAIMRPREREAQTPALRRPAPHHGQEAEATPAPSEALPAAAPEPPAAAPSLAAPAPVREEPQAGAVRRAAVIEDALKAAAAEVEARDRAEAALLPPDTASN